MKNKMNTNKRFFFVVDDVNMIMRYYTLSFLWTICVGNSINDVCVCVCERERERGGGWCHSGD